MITFKDLIDKVNFELVWEEYLNFYPHMVNSRQEYSNLYKFLQGREAEQNIQKMIIHIDRNDYEEFDDEVQCGLGLDSKGIEELGYHVHGKSNSTEWNGYWDLSVDKWGNWLGFYIHDKAIKSLSMEQIVALCFYEMTWHALLETDVINWKNCIGIDDEE